MAAFDDVNKTAAVVYDRLLTEGLLTRAFCLCMLFGTHRAIHVTCTVAEVPEHFIYDEELHEMVAPPPPQPTTTTAVPMSLDDVVKKKWKKSKKTKKTKKTKEVSKEKATTT